MNDASRIKVFQVLLRTSEYGTQMIELLKREAALIKSRNIKEVQTISEEKQLLAAKLEELSHSHGIFYGNQERAIPNEASDTMVFSRDIFVSDPELKQTVSDVRSLLAQCKRLNESNGACIELLKRHYQRAMDIIYKASNSTPTYGPDGITSNSALSRTLTFV